MAHPLTVAEVHAVVAIAVDGFFVANARQDRLASSETKAAVKGRPRITFPLPSTPIGHFLIDVDGLVLVQAEDVSVFGLEHRVVIQRPAITDD